MLFLWEKEKEWPRPMMILKASGQLWHLSLLPTFLLVKASHRAELHISGQRSVLSHVNQSRDNGQDYLMFLQGGGVDQWEPKDILPPAALALIATFQVAELPPTSVTKQHTVRNHA